jgi:hypothetical protein
MQSATHPDEVHPTEAKIKSYLHRKDNWHFGEGVAFDPGVVDAAVKLHRFIVSKGHYRTNAFPGLGGEVIVVVYHGPRYYEFVVMPDHHLVYTHEVDDKEIVYREPISVEDAYAIIEDIRAGAWNSSESLLESTTTRIEVDSRAGLFAILEVAAESLSSRASAWLIPVAASVVTSGPTMPTSGETVRFSGTYPRAIFPAIAS